MVTLADPRTFWLNVTNIGLGSIVVVAFLILVAYAAWEAFRRRAS